MRPPRSVTKPFKFGDWTVTINKVNWNAWKAIHKANMFNDKNPKGTTEVMLYGNVKYNGTGREEFDPYQLKAVGASSSEYSMLDDPDCGVMPTPDMNIDGKTASSRGQPERLPRLLRRHNGDVEESQRLRSGPDFSFDDEDIVEFALRSADGSASPEFKEPNRASASTSVLRAYTRPVPRGTGLLVAGKSGVSGAGRRELQDLGYGPGLADPR